MILGEVISGYLSKMGEVVRSWRRRWFVLSISNKLSYYEERDVKVCKGTIDLNNVSAVRRSKDSRPGEFGFELVTPKRTYFLAAESEMSADEWMTALSSRIRLVQ